MVRVFFLVIKNEHDNMLTSPHDNTPPESICVCVQAWAFASGARWVLGMSPVMNLEDFPSDVWYAHRKLFHRFMKYKKYIVKATSGLAEMKEKKEMKVKKDEEEVPTSSPQIPTSQHVISLLTDSEGEVSSDSSTEVEDDVERLFDNMSESESSDRIDV